MRSRNILIIVEGERAEDIFIRSIFAISFPDQEIKIYSYGTSIHQLISELYPRGVFDPDLDICALLAENEDDSIKKGELLKPYTDKYLVFDFEPQHHVLRFEQVYKMLEFYNDSTNNGKLYINYPMLESYRHVAKMPDLGFRNKTVSISEVYQYKQLVQEEGSDEYNNPRRYNYITLVSLALHHVMKANQILTNQYAVPELDEYLSWNGEEIYEYQMILCREERCAVLSTSIWTFIDYAPKSFFNFLIPHRGELTI